MRGACSNSSSADERAKSVKGDLDRTKAAVTEMLAKEDAERRAKSERLRAMRLAEAASA